MEVTHSLLYSILQAAIQGKLTEQLKNDSECDLHVSVQVDSAPFDIPNYWTWTSIERSCTDIRYGTSKKSSPIGEVAVLRMGNIQNGKIDYSDLVYTSDQSDIKALALNYNDILFNRTNSRELVGKTGIYKGEYPAIFAGYLIRLTPAFVNADYLNLVMQSQYFKIFCNAVKTDAIGQSNINGKNLKKFVYPLPPIEEQQRIVDRVNELLAKVDEFEKIEQQLTALKASFPGDMRAAILQAAMQGKLTEQLETDSSVEELHNILCNQRNELIKSKQIKNEKFEPISDFPFDIPDSWMFIRLGETIKLLSGQDFTPDNYSDVKIENSIPYLTGASNLNNGEVIINRWTLCGRAIAYKDDLLITCKGTVGEMAFLPVEKAHIARQIMAINTLGNVNLFYVKYCLESCILSIKAKAKSEIPGIGRKVILNQIVPLPPIEEQQRIVERLDKLLPLCDGLIE